MHFIRYLAACDESGAYSVTWEGACYVACLAVATAEMAQAVSNFIIFRSLRSRKGNEQQDVYINVKILK